MGASESDSLKDELSDYRVTGKDAENDITHLCHIETDNQYLLHQLTFNDRDLYQRSYEEHVKRSKLPADHLTHASRVQCKEIDHLCSNIYKIYSIWEYPMRFLSEEISERALQDRKFKGRELWSILASCIYGMSTLQHHRIKHQCLSSNLILLDNEGIVKVADPLATAANKNFELVYKNRNIQNIYLSPEQCASLETRSGYSNSYKNDIWSMGMILLECGLLESQGKCYRNNYQKVDFIEINESLRRFSERYREDQFTNILKLMLKRDEKDRPDWVGLKQLTSRSTNSSRQHDVTKQLYQGRVSYSSMGKDQRVSSFQNPSRFGSRSPLSKPQIRQNYLSTQQVPIGDFSSQQEKPAPNHSRNTFFPNVQKPQLFRPEFQMAPFERKSPKPYTQYPPSRDPSPIIYPNSHTNILADPNSLNALRDYPSSLSGQSQTYQAINNQLPSVYHNQQAGYLFGGWRKPEQPLRQGYHMNDQPFLNKNQFNHNLNPQSRHQAYANGQSQLQSNYMTAQQTATYAPKHTFSTGYPESRRETPSQLHQDPDRFTSSNHDSVSQQNESVLRSKSIEAIEPNELRREQQEQPKQKETNQQHQNLEYVVETFKQGSRYEGFKLNHMRHGQGRFFYQDGGMYDGEWKMNQMDGYGALYYQSGKLAYEGQWEKDHFEGKGKLYNQLPFKSQALFNYIDFDQIQDLWECYDGQFKEDFKKGNGKLFLANGEYFQGSFSNDMVQGIGEYHRRNGQVIRGLWSQNHLMQQL